MFKNARKILQRMKDKESPRDFESSLSFASPAQDSRRVIVVCNQKGGCGKTTTVINLAAFWAKRGKRVLIIDLDTQAHASLGLGLDVDHLERSIYDVLINSVELDQVIVSTKVKGLSVAPANHLLSGAQLQLANLVARESILKINLNKLALTQHYDYVLIDTSPTLNLITLNGLAAATHVLIPIQPHYFSLEGMKELFITIDLVKERLNSELKILGIVATLYDHRIKANRDIFKELNEYFTDLMLKTPIRYTAKLVEAPSYQLPIVFYAPDSKGAQDYFNLSEELEGVLLKGRNNVAEFRQSG